MIEPKAKKEIGDWMDVPPTFISDMVHWSSVSESLKETAAARRTNFIILIIRIHKGNSEEGRCRRKSWAAPMRVSHSATFISCSICSPGSFWGSFGGMKTCSTTERKTLEPILRVTGGDCMTVRDEFIDVATIGYCTATPCVRS